MKQGTRDWIAGSLVGWIIGVVLLLPAIPALATHDCIDAYNNIQQGSLNKERGEFVAEMSTYAHNNPDQPHGYSQIHCHRVSTIVVWNATDTSMEIGWHARYSDVPTICAAPSAQQPYLAIARNSPTGGQDCRVGPTAVQLATGTHSFKVTDPNKDGVWKFYLDGSQVGTATSTSWDIGLPWANGERWNLSSDSAQSRFIGLDYIDATGPHDWTINTIVCDEDTDYDSNEVSNQVDTDFVSFTESGYNPGCF